MWAEHLLSLAQVFDVAEVAVPGEDMETEERVAPSVIAGVLHMRLIAAARGEGLKWKSTTPGWPPSSYRRQPSPAVPLRAPFIPHSMEGVNAFWVLYPQHIVVFAHLNPYIYSKAYR